MIPGCLALVRRHLFANPGDRLADVGCGSGEVLDAVLTQEPEVEAWGVDLSAAMLRRTQATLGRRAQLVRASATRLPWASDTFDWLVSTETLHCVDRPRDALAEWRRVLRTDGRLLLIDWSAEYAPTRWLWMWRRRQGAAVGPVVRAEALGAELVDAGFADVRIESRRLTPLWAVLVITARAVSPSAAADVGSVHVLEEQHRADA